MLIAEHRQIRHLLRGGVVRLSFEEAERWSPTSITNSGHIFKLSEANIAYQIESGLIRNAAELLQMERLAGINQLQFLTSIKVNEQTPVVRLPHTFLHTRYEHSLGVAALMAFMLRQNGIEGSQADHALLAALVHDALTSAGGDALKIIDPDFFDEDKHVSKLFQMQKNGWDELRRRYQLTPAAGQDIEQIVQGQGLGGKLLDIADSCSYLALDVAELQKALVRHPQPSDGYRTVFEIAAKRPCTLWESVEVVGDHAVVADPYRLADFLTLRVLMWRYLYNHPGNKYLECLMTEVVLPHLLRTRKISTAHLLKWTDRDLYRLIEKTIGARGSARNLAAFGTPPLRESFKTWEEANRREEELVRRGSFTVMGDVRLFQEIKPKTNKYFVRGADGSPVTFEQAYPDRAREIARLASGLFGPPVQVYYVPRPAIDLSSITPAWRAARARWKERRG